MSPLYADFYEGFYEAEREPMGGRLTFAGMNAVLDEYGYSDLQERKLIRGLWRRMEAAALKARDKAKGDEGDK